MIVKQGITYRELTLVLGILVAVVVLVMFLVSNYEARGFGPSSINIDMNLDVIKQFTRKTLVSIL